MNPETTTQEMRLPQLQSWLISFGLHGFLLFGFLSLFHQPLAVNPTVPFHWDVTLVQSPQPTSEAIQTAAVPQPAVPKQPDRTPTAPHVSRTTRHAAPFPERIISHAPTTEAPVISPSKVATTSIPNESPSTQDQATELPQQQTESPISPTTSTSPGLETVVPDTTIEGHTTPTNVSQPSPAPATTSDPATISSTRPDYGWLQQAIFRRLEELKRSTHPFLDQSQPLKVLVRAVVSHEGALLEAEVVKSSGLGRIDQEAMALVQRAFPMQLDRPLDRQQVAMRIPITYSRE